MIFDHFSIHEAEAAVPADVLSHMFIGAVDQEDRVVSWDVASCEGGVKVHADGPQSREGGHKQDQDLQEGCW